VAEGRITGLWRYPVKSMGGEPVRSAKVDWRGMGGDRTHAVLFDSKTGRRPLTAREAAGLLAFHASYPFAPDAGLDPANPPAAQVMTPDGQRLSWQDARLKRRLQDDFGRELHMERSLDGLQDLGQTLLVTVEASRVALEGELGRGVDLRRFRPNVHLELDGEPPWAELGWEGRHMRFDGGVVLELLHPCERCAIPNRDPDTQERWPGLMRHLAREHDTLFGINARVVVAGRIAVGHNVQVA
jgi:MOSC domain-containing protein